VWRGPSNVFAWGFALPSSISRPQREPVPPIRESLRSDHTAFLTIAGLSLLAAFVKLFPTRTRYSGL